MATSDNTPALLALPVELVSRMADSLEPESLLMLRLTCKALEHSTYDLFAKTFFERRFCCVYYEPRWLLMKAVISSRLGGRVRELICTSEPLESKCYKDVQLAPSERQMDIKTAQCDADDELSLSLGPETQIPAWPNTAIFNRVFRDMKRLAPNALITFDLICTMAQDTFDMVLPLNADILVAAVIAGVAIDSLTLVVQNTYWLINVLKHLEPELTASIRSFRKLHLDQLQPENDSYRGQFVTTLLEAAGELRELVVCFSPFNSATAAIL